MAKYPIGRLWCAPKMGSKENANTWRVKEWKGTPPTDSGVWSDGVNVYWSSTAGQYVLNGDTWEPKTWNGFNPTNKYCIWTDGANIYYSSNSDDGKQYVLNGDTWEPKTWSGLVPDGWNIWSDGSNIYHSEHFSGDNAQYILNGDTWVFDHNAYIRGGWVWTNGTNLYYSEGSKQYVRSGSSWTTKKWYGLPENLSATDLFTDGKKMYYQSADWYVLNGDTWEPKTWIDEPPRLEPGYIWSDGGSIYYSRGSYQYELVPDSPPEPAATPLTGPTALLLGFLTGKRL